MKILKMHVKWFCVILLSLFVTSSLGNDAKEGKVGENRAHSSPDPFGLWKSTGGMLRRGIRMFRDNLQEGVKIAKMLKEDMDTGITGKFGHKNSTSSSSSSSSEDSSDIEANEGKKVDGPASKENVLLGLFQNKQFTQREGMLGGILKLVGFDSNSIGIIVLNVLIFIAEMVTSSLLGKESNSISDKRELRSNILELLTTGRNDKLEHFFQEAQDHSLPENIIKLLQSRTGNKTSCVQLLLCKIKPFIWSVQKTVSQQINGTATAEGRAYPNANSLLDHKYISSVWDQLNQVLPSKANFVNYGNECEEKYPVCQLLKFQERDKHFVG